MPPAKPLTLKQTAEFRLWFEEQDDTDQALMHSRFELIQEESAFGFSRYLGGGMIELKWKSGMRVYCSRKRIAGVDVIVLWGGFKGRQRHDIEKARRIKKGYEDACKS